MGRRALLSATHSARPGGGEHHRISPVIVRPFTPVHAHTDQFGRGTECLGHTYQFRRRAEWLGKLES